MRALEASADAWGVTRPRPELAGRRITTPVQR